MYKRDWDEEYCWQVSIKISAAKDQFKVVYDYFSDAVQSGIYKRELLKPFIGYETLVLKKKTDDMDEIKAIRQAINNYEFIQGVDCEYAIDFIIKNAQQN